MAALAEACYVAVAPHHDGGPIATAAALHLAASLPNFVIQHIPPATAEDDRRMREAVAGRTSRSCAMAMPRCRSARGWASPSTSVPSRPTRSQRDETTAVRGRPGGDGRGRLPPAPVAAADANASACECGGGAQAGPLPGPLGSEAFRQVGSRVRITGHEGVRRLPDTRFGPPVRVREARDRRRASSAGARARSKARPARSSPA